MRNVSLFLVKTECNNSVNNNMIISDYLDNAEEHHSLGKSKKVNLNLNFAHKKYLIFKLPWDYYNLKPSRK